jgi:hypothetical protein
MSKYANPPKVRSYFDHKPHSATDNKPKFGRAFDTYFGHFPVDQSDIFFKPNRAYINSYIDHFARSNDTRLQ